MQPTSVRSGWLNRGSLLFAFCVCNLMGVMCGVRCAVRVTVVIRYKSQLPQIIQEEQSLLAEQQRTRSPMAPTSSN